MRRKEYEDEMRLRKEKDEEYKGMSSSIRRAGPHEAIWSKHYFKLSPTPSEKQQSGGRRKDEERSGEPGRYKETKDTRSLGCSGEMIWP